MNHEAAIEKHARELLNDVHGHRLNVIGEHMRSLLAEVAPLASPQPAPGPPAESASEAAREADEDNFSSLLAKGIGDVIRERNSLRSQRAKDAERIEELTTTLETRDKQLMHSRSVVEIRCREISDLTREAERLRNALDAQHKWHLDQTERTPVFFGDTIGQINADEYQDSELFEITHNALNPNQTGGQSDPAGGATFGGVVIGAPKTTPLNQLEIDELKSRAQPKPQAAREALPPIMKAVAALRSLPAGALVYEYEQILLTFSDAERIACLAAEKELAEAKRTIESLNDHGSALERMDLLKSLTAEREEMVKDKERLDWLSANSQAFWINEPVALVVTGYEGGNNLKDACRAAIDAAMSRVKEMEGEG